MIKTHRDVGQLHHRGVGVVQSDLRETREEELLCSGLPGCDLVRNLESRTHHPGVGRMKSEAIIRNVVY